MNDKEKMHYYVDNEKFSKNFRYYGDSVQNEIRRRERSTTAVARTVFADQNVAIPQNALGSYRTTGTALGYSRRWSLWSGPS